VLIGGRYPTYQHVGFRRYFKGLCLAIGCSQPFSTVLFSEQFS